MMQLQKSDISHFDFSSSECEISYLMTDAEKPRYYDALMRLMPQHMTKASWAREAGVSSSFFNDLKAKGSRPRHDTLTKLLDAANLSITDFNLAVDGDAPAPKPLPDDNVREAPLRFRHRSNPMDVPVYGTAEGADLNFDDNGESRAVKTTTMMPDEIVDHIRRPIGLAERHNVYALYVVGTSMKPWKKDGDPIFVDPIHQPSIDDHVVVQLLHRHEDGDGEVIRTMVKLLVKRTANYIELEQYTPGLTFRVPVNMVASLHRVITDGEMHGI